VTAVNAKHPRRTQEERSAGTQRRILDAALECLADHGYAGTTTTVVAERAGVSRGAQLHHFRTRAELVAAAVQHLFAQLREEYERAFAERAPRGDRIGVAIDLLWKIFQDPRLAAVLELYVAGRTDADLHAQIAPVAARHYAHVVRLAREFFPQASAREHFDDTLDLVLDTLQGMAVRQLVRPDETDLRRTLKLIKRLAAEAIAAEE
jgi:AcrR family transcriptional regulator